MEYTDEAGNKIEVVPKADLEAINKEFEELKTANEEASKRLADFEAKTKAEELKATEEQTKALESKRENLVKMGVDADKVAKMPMELLEVLETTLNMSKRTSKMDMGAGGGSGGISGSPLELARQAYSK